MPIFTIACYVLHLFGPHVDSIHYFVEFVLVDLVPELVLGNGVEDEGSELTGQPRRYLLKHPVLHSPFMHIFNKPSFLNGEVICFENLVYEQLGNRHPFHEGTEADFVSVFL